VVVTPCGFDSLSGHQESNQERKQAPKRPYTNEVDKALLIALATPIAYLLVFQFNRGFLNFFGVADTLVDVSLRDLSLAAVATLSVAFALYNFFTVVPIFLPERWPQQKQGLAIWPFWIAGALESLMNGGSRQCSTVAPWNVWAPKSGGV
jgi:hypothetical protein